MKVITIISCLCCSIGLVTSTALFQSKSINVFGSLCCSIGLVTSTALFQSKSINVFGRKFIKQENSLKGRFYNLLPTNRKHHISKRTTRNCRNDIFEWTGISYNDSCSNALLQFCKFDCRHHAQADNLYLVDGWPQAKEVHSQCNFRLENNNTLISKNEVTALPMSTVVRVWFNGSLWKKIKVIPSFLCSEVIRNNSD